MGGGPAQGGGEYAGAGEGYCQGAAALGEYASMERGQLPGGGMGGGGVMVGGGGGEANRGGGMEYGGAPASYALPAGGMAPGAEAG